MGNDYEMLTRLNILINKGILPSYAKLKVRFNQDGSVETFAPYDYDLSEPYSLIIASELLEILTSRCNSNKHQK